MHGYHNADIHCPLTTPWCFESTEFPPEHQSLRSTSQIVDCNVVIERLCESQSQLLSLARHADEKLEVLLSQLQDLESKQMAVPTLSRSTTTDQIPFEPVVEHVAWNPVTITRNGSACTNGSLACNSNCALAPSLQTADSPALSAPPEATRGVRGLSDQAHLLVGGAPAPPSMEPAALPRDLPEVEKQMSKKGRSRSFTSFNWDGSGSCVTSASSLGDGRQRPIRRTWLHAVKSLSQSSVRNASVQQKQGRFSVLANVVLDPKFDIGITCVVVFNALLVGLQVQDHATNLGEESETLQIAEYVCTCIFTAELLLRTIGMKGRICSKEQRLWTVIDTALVILGVADMMFDIMQVELLPESSQDDTGIARQYSSIAKIAKVMQLTRFIRVLRLIRFLASVRLMVIMIFGSLGSLFWLFVLISIVFYLFSVVLTHGATEWRRKSAGGADDVGQVSHFFGSIENTMYTLFICTTGGLSWSEAALLVFDFGTFYFAVFMFFLFFIFFSVLNIVTGVFVDTAIQQAERDRSLYMLQAEKAKKALLEDLRELLVQLDSNIDGVISESEWFERIDDPLVKTLFSRLEIPLTDTFGLFEVFDVNGDGIISISELVAGVETLAGVAHNMHLLKIQKLVQDTNETVYRLERGFNFIDHRHDKSTQTVEPRKGPELFMV
eukprot:TRINITY_DN3927_c0_g1_i1.p1 TRINITY_DN3927_c0_g1~~TRINITY_DN3927_c0_g1_i1.p1  ORF type:complete len:667 (+),score=98.84 TRINITY_DN3927_c0_g1_i1:1633-3633(+)